MHDRHLAIAIVKGHGPREHRHIDITDDIEVHGSAHHVMVGYVGGHFALGDADVEGCTGYEHVVASLNYLA